MARTYPLRRAAASARIVVGTASNCLTAPSICGCSKPPTEAVEDVVILLQRRILAEQCHAVVDTHDECFQPVSHGLGLALLDLDLRVHDLVELRDLAQQGPLI